MVDFGAVELLSDWSGDFLEFFGSECSAAGWVKGLKNGLKGGLIGWVPSETEDLNESSKVELSADSCSVDDGEDLSGLGLKAESLDGVDQLINGDVAAAVVIEDIEDFFEFSDSLGIEVLLHVLVAVEGGFGRCCFGHKIFLI